MSITTAPSADTTASFVDSAKRPTAGTDTDTATNGSRKRTRKVKSEALAIQQSGPVERVQPDSIEEAITRLERVRKFISKALNQGLQRAEVKAKKLKKTLTENERKRLEIDYGTIPGVHKKFLLQPGAEKICLWLHVRPVYERLTAELPNGHLEVVTSVRLVSVSDGTEVFQGPGASCSSMESNFRYRWVKREPQPAKDWVFSDEAKGLKASGQGKSIREYKNNVAVGWLWMDRQENPNIYDERNKVRQMGDKRALVKAVRNYGALSEIFTEDPSEWAFDEEETPAVEAQPSGKVVREEPQEKQGEPTAESHKAQSPAAEAPQTPKPIVQVSWPSDSSEFALVHLGTGTGKVTDWMRDTLGGEWRDKQKAWAVPAQRVPDLAAACENAGYSFQEVQPSKSSGAAPSTTGTAPSPHRVAVVTAIKVGTTKNKGIEKMEILWGGVWHYCFNKSLFAFLNEAKMKDCIFDVSVDKPPKIIGIRKIGKREFDGDVPVIQSSEERPKTTEDLFK